MNDMRVLFSIFIGALTGIGLLFAKAFAFSIAWVLWPIGVIAVFGFLALLVLSGWSQ